MASSYVQLHFSNTPPADLVLEEIMRGVPTRFMLGSCVLAIPDAETVRQYFADAASPENRIIKVGHPNPTMVTSAIGQVVSDLTERGYEINNYQQIIMT